MGDKQFVQQLRIVTTHDTIRPGTNVQPVSFFDEDGNPVDPSTVTPAAANADVATANATDLPTAIALANATKASHNSLQAKLRTAGLLLP